MKVNEVIIKLQKMIANGNITGDEYFGIYEFDWEIGEYFEEAQEIQIMEDEEWGDVVYIS